MDVLIAHPFALPEVRRGAERYLEDLAAYLRGRGLDVGVLTTAPGRHANKGGGVEYRGRWVSNWLTGRGVDPLVAFAPTMLWPMWRRHARIVHPLTHGAGLASVLTKSAGHAVVATLMGIPYRWFTEQTPSSARAWHLLIERADELICPSTHVAEVLREEYGRAGVVIPLGVDTSFFRPAAERARPPTILFAGALEEPRKGFALLLEAFRRVAGDRDGLRIVATGHGSLEPAHRARGELPAGIRERVRVLHLGIEELPAAYSEASVTVLPSRNEALGLTLVESLACGTPVVGSDECGIVDVIDEPSIGRRFVPDDADDLARALLEALDLAADPATRDRCRRSAGRFDWQTTVGPAVEAVYARVAPS
ncbi:MAG: glycosyltransferase family 4 protein [Actinomycetota bacterium]